jgi:hypothetical protein
MDLKTEITVLTALSTALFVVGTLFILFFGATLATVGLVLIVASVLVLFVDVADVIGNWEQVVKE